MINLIQKFSVSAVVAKINEIAGFLNGLTKSSEGLVELKGRQNPSLRINVDRLRARMPHFEGTGVTWAYCSDTAGTGSSLACYIGADNEGDTVTVYFTLLGGISNLSDGHLSLVDGTPIPIAIRDGEWWCIIPIEGTEDCT